MRVTQQLKFKHGLTRLVIVLNNFVIKVPSFKYGWYYFLEGIMSNIQENDIYNTAVYRGIYADVIWCDPFGFILIMEKCSEINVNENLLLKHLKTKYIKDDRIKNIISDFKLSNFGIDKNGQIVKIDYGGFKIS